MSRSAAPSDSRLARLRQHYGLRQAELAALLGLSGAQLSRLEAGQQGITRAVAERLAPFLAALEAAEAAPPPIAPPPGAFDPAPLERRRAACLHEAHNLRWRLRELPEQAAVAARWAQALPGLRAALPPAEEEAPATREAVRLRYVRSYLETVPLALPPDVLAAWHLGQQRALALEAEAAALAALLAGADHSSSR
ncbi:MAG: helix-turn-helix domain-containing protein [Janthinobacterium lividum]